MFPTQREEGRAEGGYDIKFDGGLILKGLGANSIEKGARIT